MPPFFPEHPLTTITAGERATAAELQTRSALEAEHLVKRPIKQFPAGTVLIQILDRSSRTIGNDLIAFAPCDAIHIFQSAVVFQSPDQAHDGLFALAANDEIHIKAFAQDALIGICWIDSAINYFDLGICAFDLVNGLDGGLV